MMPESPPPSQPPAPVVEEVPFVCPACGRSNATQVAETKRGKFIKCLPERGGCGYDTARPEDWGTRKNYVREAIRALKAEFPYLTFFENKTFPFNPLTKRASEQKRNYDYSAWLGPHQLERIRVLTIRGQQTFASYSQTPEQYLLGSMKVVDALREKDALLLFYFAEAPPKPTTALAEAHRVGPYLTEAEDRFGNLQYHIPVEVRPVLLVEDHEEKERMLLRKLPHAILEQQEVV